MANCPCGSNISYDDCCGSYIHGKKIPETPEALMRSRYTAYTEVNIAYIESTMCGKALASFDSNDAKHWSENVKWLSLTILSTPPINQEDKVGSVEFIAQYRLNNQIQALHENSQFELIDGKWFYTDGIFTQEYIKDAKTLKISRNDPCPCNSGKKYKKCCLNK
ncbi:MAG: YchJ family protein [Gammaproteobacteria bacterium]